MRARWNRRGEQQIRTKCHRILENNFQFEIDIVGFILYTISHSYYCVMDDVAVDVVATAAADVTAIGIFHHISIAKHGNKLSLNFETQ